MLLLIIALLTVVFTPGRVHQEDIYLYPKDSIRPTWCLVSNCYTIETLIKNETLRELSNTTLFFLQGIHTIKSDTNETVSITSTTNFTLKAANGTEGATIKCNGNVGFKFTKYVSYIEISGIIFDNCGTSHYLQTNDESSDAEVFVLAITHSYNISVNALSIKYGKGTGLYLQNVYGYFTLSHALFTMNNVNLDVIIEDDSYENQYASGNATC